MPRSRHCERSEAISCRLCPPRLRLLRRRAPRNDRHDRGLTACRPSVGRVIASPITAAGRGCMRFGFFDQLPCPPGFSEHQRYQDIIAQIELGDAVGFDTVWLGELHFSRGFSILADPLMVLAAAAQRAPRIRLGTAVTLLPLPNPVKNAQEAAIPGILPNRR